MAYSRFNPLGKYEGVQFVLPTNTSKGLGQGGEILGMSPTTLLLLAAAAGGVWYFFLRNK